MPRNRVITAWGAVAMTCHFAGWSSTAVLAVVSPSIISLTQRTGTVDFTKLI